MLLPPSRIAAACLLLWCATASFTVPFDDDAPPASDDWRQYADAEQSGFAADALAAARRAASEAGSAALMVVHGGHVVAAWGAVEAPLPVGAIEPALASLLFGIAHDAGRVDLDATLATLGVEDVVPLTEEERAATVGDVLRMRSNVWRPAREGSGLARDWHWNGWDANVLSELFRLQTGATLGQALADSLAVPLGFEEFDAARDLSTRREPEVSRFDARLLRLSARDLARVGQLVADEGAWRGRPIVSASWITESTTAVAPFPPDHEHGEGNGFGRMWWTLPRRARAASHCDRYAWIAAEGDGGDRLLIAPAIDLVLVHRGGARGVSDAAVTKVIEAVVAARRGPPAEGATFTNVTPLPFRAE